MSNLYQLTQQIHTLAQEKAKKHGLELEIESDYFVSEDNKIYHNYMFPFNGETGDFEKNLIQSSIQTDQIRQILWVFREVLGENPEYTATNWTYGGVVDPNFQNEELWRAKLERLPKTKAEALCQKWLGGLQPFFNSEPVTVLHELITILESI